jgi:hypothetical protein
MADKVDYKLSGIVYSKEDASKVAKLGKIHPPKKPKDNPKDYVKVTDYHPKTEE